MGGSTGHLSAFDWKNGKLLCELNVKEPIRDVQWLHNENLFAVAQKKYTYIYDSSGVEVHALRKHTEATCLQFLPYHLLLVSGGKSGLIRYQDISTGKIAAEWKTRVGPTLSLAQNQANAIIHAGHSAGTVAFWSPNSAAPLVKMLCHRGPVTSIAIDVSGHVMATAGVDKQVKLWDLRTYNLLSSYPCRVSPTSVDISQTGLLSMTFGSTVNILKDSWNERQKSPYMNHVVPGGLLQMGVFCPFDDVLGLGHVKGFSSVLVPGSGEANFHSYEINPYETKKQRREGEVKTLLGKLQPELISLDTDAIGKIKEDRSFSAPQDPSDATLEQLEKAQVKRKKRIAKKYLNKQRNVFDSKKAAIREKIEQDRKKRSLECAQKEPSGLLDRLVTNI